MSEDHEKSGHKPAAGGHGGGHRGGGHEEHHEGAPEWLISFADNTALMMGFFVIMLALTMAAKPQGAATAKNTEEEKSEAATASGQSTAQLDFALGVRAAFHNPVTVNSTRPEDQYLVMRLREKTAGENEQLDENVRGKADLAQSLDRGLMEFKVGIVLFKEDTTTPAGEFTEVLDSFAHRARGLRQIVEVRGHVSAHEAAAGGEQAMALSFQRAQAVAHQLAVRGLTWNQMRIIAAGNAEPQVRRAYDRDQRALNARVEMTITDQVLTSED